MSENLADLSLEELAARIAQEIGSPSEPTMAPPPLSDIENESITEAKNLFLELKVHVSLIETISEQTGRKLNVTPQQFDFVINKVEKIFDLLKIVVDTNGPRKHEAEQLRKDVNNWLAPFIKKYEDILKVSRASKRIRKLKTRKNSKKSKKSRKSRKSKKSKKSGKSKNK